MEAVGYAGVPGLELDAGEGAVGEEEGVVGVFLDAEGVGAGLVRGCFEGLGGCGEVRLGVEEFGFFVVAGLEAPGGR